MLRRPSLGRPSGGRPFRSHFRSTASALSLLMASLWSEADATGQDTAADTLDLYDLYDPEAWGQEEGLRPARTGPHLGADVALITGGTVAWSFTSSHVRRHMFPRGWARNIGKNFADPIGRAFEVEDRDPFAVNYVTHPLTWGGMGYYLKARGHSNATALAFTQAHSVVWEYVIEGSWSRPSGRDLVTNFVAPVVAIYVLHPLLGGDAGDGAAEANPALAAASAAEPQAAPAWTPLVTAGDGTVTLGVTMPVRF